MRGKLLRLATWFLRWTMSKDPRLAAVRTLVAEASKFDADGQRKRSWVLNNIVTQFPEARIRDLALLIELVMQES